MHREEKIKRSPVIIYDKYSVLVCPLIEKLKQDFFCVVFSSDNFISEEFASIKIAKKVVSIPENKFESIFYIYDDSKISNIYLNLFLRLSTEQNIPINVISSIYNLDRNKAEKIIKYKNSKVFYYGDLISKDYMSDKTKKVFKHIEDNKILLHGDGTGILYPTTKSFLINSLVYEEIVYKKNKEKIICFFNEFGMTELSFARLAMSIKPDYKLVFNGSKKKLINSFTLNKSNKYIYENEASIKKELRDILNTNQIPDSKFINSNKFVNKFRYVPKIILFSFIIPAVISFILLLFSFIAFYFLKSDLRTNIFFVREKSIQYRFNFARSLFYSGSLIIEPYLHIVKYLSFNRIDAYKIIMSYEKRIEEYNRFLSIVDTYSKILKGYEINEKEFIDSNSLLKKSITESNLEPDSIAAKFYKDYSKITEVFLASVDNLQSILGFDGERKYLLLFVNSNELRPGGGFIGSYSIINIKNGKAGEIKIDDIYNLDGRLKGRIEPPLFLSQYMGISNWFLRDSNTSYDSLENAKSASQFIKLILGENIDGVFVINSNLIKDLLYELGEINIEGYGKINAENFEVYSQSIIQDNFFPGSNQKRNFLNVLYNELTSSIVSKGGYEKLLRVIDKSLRNKNIILSFEEQNIQTSISLAGVGSTLLQKQESPEEINDFFGISEANLSANKVNKYIKRILEKEIIITEDGNILSNIILTLENSSSKIDKFSGPYNVYIRFILPLGVSPSEISIDKVKQVILSPLFKTEQRLDRGDVSANTIEIERVDEKNKSIYGFFTTVNQQEKKEIEVKYSIDRRLKLNKEMRYNLEVFKQPGTLDDKFKFSLTYPESLDLIRAENDFKKQKSFLYHEGYLNEDKFYEIDFLKKISE